MRSAFGTAGLLAAWLVWANAACAQDGFEALQVRANVATAAMVSRDQTGRLGYDTFGLLLGAQLGYALLPWLEPQLGVAAGGFPAVNGRTGGLISPLAGVLVGTLGRTIRPYAQLDLGAAFTGELSRPFFRAGIGVDFRVSNAFVLGPTVGYGQVFHPNIAGNSSDARFFSFGASLLFRPGAPAEPAPPSSAIYEHVRVPVPVRVPIPGPPPPPPEPVAPSERLLVLIDEAVPKEQVELLAPVLFAFDSDELEPTGVAMLHEVARELAQRSEIELVEIQGHADNRGDGEYNAQLSARRARRVLQWLIDHGIDPGRLQVAARGEGEPIEPSEADAAHEQNRRVVFRVLRMRQP